MPYEAPQVQVEFTPEFKIYSKLDQADISPDQIRRILLEFEQQGNL